MAVTWLQKVAPEVYRNNTLKCDAQILLEFSS